ncbi:hypothetical protein BDK92_7228 [Micromonospora pisi]|uniref:Uncharacterized protein n=1 Tax=Micromonospora pisi TaxID=589240 RepID=A0A495JX39_9ACTN|nr:hypothetical protein [Micromonospora pisi]RKR92749.1 hypothetical protein BDK92_7228 [Micromonospora pisi]
MTKREPVSVDEADPVGATEIAERAGVGRPAVERWQERHADTWPERRWTVGGRPAWDWAVDIVPWLEATGRIEPQVRSRSTAANRRRRLSIERSPETARPRIRAEVMAYDEPMDQQRLDGAAEVEAMVDEILAAWLANPVGHRNGLRGFTERWLRDHYATWRAPSPASTHAQTGGLEA